MIRISIFSIVCLVAVTTHAADLRVLPDTASLDNKIAIVEKQSNNGDRDCYFRDRSTGKNLGLLLPPDQRGQLRVVGVTAGWNRTGSKVALVVSYGTKLSELLVFTRNARGRFEQIKLDAPDAEKLYHDRARKTIPHRGDGYDENLLGPWLDENTVCLASGNASQMKDINHYIHIFATFKVRIKANTATISDIRLVGPLSDSKRDDFLMKWLERGFGG